MAYRQRIMVGVTFLPNVKKSNLGNHGIGWDIQKEQGGKSPRAKNRAVSAITGREILSTVNML